MLKWLKVTDLRMVFYWLVVDLQLTLITRASLNSVYLCIQKLTKWFDQPNCLLESRNSNRFWAFVFLILLIFSSSQKANHFILLQDLRLPLNHAYQPLWVFLDCLIAFYCLMCWRTMATHKHCQFRGTYSLDVHNLLN